MSGNSKQRDQENSRRDGEGRRGNGEGRRGNGEGRRGNGEGRRGNGEGHGHKPPRDEHKPPRDEHKPPRDEHKPPRDEHKPPRDEHKPPRDEHKPPRDEHKPPREEPPKEEPKTPRRQPRESDRDDDEPHFQHRRREEPVVIQPEPEPVPEPPKEHCPTVIIHDKAILHIGTIMNAGIEGGHPKLERFEVGEISDQSGPFPGNPMMALRPEGMSWNAYKEYLCTITPEQYVDEIVQRMAKDPELKDAVLKGLKEMGEDSEHVQGFLHSQGVDSIQALERKLVDIATQIPQSSDPKELQALVTALGQDIGPIDGIVGKGTKAGLEALGIDPSLDTADAIDALREKVRADMNPAKLDELYGAADNPTDTLALQAALRATGQDIVLDGVMGPGTRGAVNAVHATYTLEVANAFTDSAAKANVDTSPGLGSTKPVARPNSAAGMSS